MSNDTEAGEVDLKITHIPRSDELSNKCAGSDISVCSPGGSGEFPIANRSKNFNVNLAPGKENFSDPYLANHLSVHNEALAADQMLPAECTHTHTHTHSVAACGTLCHKALYSACISHGLFLAIN